MVSFRSARRSNSYLVRAKLYLIKRMVGSYKCKRKGCQVYNNFTEADSFTCSNDQTNVNINNRYDCNEGCLIYLITCNDYIIIIITIIMFNVISHRNEILVFLVLAVRAYINQMSKVSQQYPFLCT